MLSVLIPTYDFVCYPLVAALQAQGERLGLDYEILVADDGSRCAESVAANAAIEALPRCRFIRRERNAGRAAIRNFLAGEARGEWLVFIDCDACVENAAFLADYAAAAAEVPVVVGGLYHTPRMQGAADGSKKSADSSKKSADSLKKSADSFSYSADRKDLPVDSRPLRECSLRLRYETEADRRRSAEERSRHPYRNFSTFNFMVRRDVFQSIRFDEGCREYGYEDTLFGAELERRGIVLRHIDNPLLHTGLDTNAQFLTKSEAALRTLSRLYDRVGEYSRVGSAYRRVENCHLAPLLRAGYRLAGPLLRRCLERSAAPSLRLFALYKLLYFARVMGSRSQ